MAGDINMKKIISLLMTVALLLSSISVFAVDANGLVIESYEYDPTDYVVSIDGKINGNMKGIPVTVQVFNPDGLLFAADQVNSNLTDNTFEVSVYIPIDMESGEYTVEISEMFYNTKVTKTFSYTGIDLLFTAVKTIADGVPAATKDTYTTLLDPYEEILNMDKALFTALSLTAKDYALSYIKSIPYDVPANVETEENMEKAKQSAVALRQAYLAGIAIGQFEDIANTTDATTWLTNYFMTYGFNSDDIETEVDESKLYEEYVNEASDSVFLSKLVTKKGLDTFNKIRDAIYECALISIVMTDESFAAKRVIEGYPTLFVGSRISELSSPTDQGYVYNQLNKDIYDYNQYADVIDIINGIVDKLLDDGPGGGSGNGSSWGSDNSNGSFSVGSVTNITNPGAGAFVDLANVKWAEKEINYLAEKKIINGKGENKFCPGDNVTRAEFLKMLALANGFGVETLTSFETSFVDVYADDWYVPYVVYCEQKGIVKGNEKGEFRPDDKITRQDIAVMIQRMVYADYEGSKALAFNDNGAISDYAVAAVDCLYNKGIVKGDENNKFNPKNNSTRAEAAVMIYRTFFE